MGKKNLQIKGPGVCAKHFWQKSKGVTGAAYITENIHQGGPDNDITIEQKLLGGGFQDGLLWTTEAVVRAQSSSGGAALEFEGEREFMKTMKTSPKHCPRS